MSFKKYGESKSLGAVDPSQISKCKCQYCNCGEFAKTGSKWCDRHQGSTDADNKSEDPDHGF